MPPRVRTGDGHDAVKPVRCRKSMPSRLFRIGFVIAITGQIASCRGDTSDGKTTSPLGPCPASSANTILPNQVYREHAPIEFRLPEGSFQSQALGDSAYPGQGWLGSAGLVVSYGVHAASLSMGEVSSGYRQIVECSERIGGRVARIRMHYSEATTAPGQYVVAQWRLSSGETLVFTATHPRSSHRSELLSIVRSVQFRDSLP